LSKRPYVRFPEKIERCLNLFKDFGWTIGDAFYYLIREVDDNNQPVTRSPMHTEMLKHWIQGNTKKENGSSPAKIVAALVNHSYAPKAAEANAFFSVKQDYTSLQAAQTGITTLAVSLIQERMETEIARAADKKAGLHTFTTGGKEIEADDFGADVIQKAISVFRRDMGIFS
jgi:hypothetical protein